MSDRSVTSNEISRWRCESYCRCGSRQGHFERHPTGEWIKALDHALELARVAKDSLGAIGKVAACEPYLKDGETPVECIERNRRDADALLTLLAAEKRKNEALLAKQALPDETSARVAEYFDIFPATGCGQCPWTVGDTYQRDCDFPDCSPRWKPSQVETERKPDRVDCGNPVMVNAEWYGPCTLPSGHGGDCKRTQKAPPRHLTQPERDALNRAAEASVTVVDAGWDCACNQPTCAYCGPRLSQKASGEQT